MHDLVALLLEDLTRHAGPTSRNSATVCSTNAPLVVVPSVVSTRSWNLLIDVDGATGLFDLKDKAPLALDPRLTPGVRR